MIFAQTYSGPYKWLADDQLEAWGGYYPKWTFVAVCLIMGIPWAFVWVTVGSRVVRSLGPLKYDSLPKPGLSRLPPGGVLLAVVFLSLGSYSSWQGYSAGPLVSVTMAEFEVGRLPQSRYVLLTGRALLEAAITVEEGKNGAVRTYTPVVSENWVEGQPYAMFLEADESRLRYRNQDEPFRGVWTRSSLPGDVRSILDQNKTQIAEPYAVLELTTPDLLVRLGYIGVGIGTACSLATAIIWARRGGYWKPLGDLAT